MSVALVFVTNYLHHTWTSSSFRKVAATVLGCEKQHNWVLCPEQRWHADMQKGPWLEAGAVTSLHSCVISLFPSLPSPAIGRLFCRLIIASPTARKEIFLCNKNSFGVFYSLLFHAKQESMTHCLLWLQKIQMKVLRVLRLLCSQYYHDTFLTERC